MSKESYLGDGLYASFDGRHVVLRAPREGIDHVVYLDAITFTALMDFVSMTAHLLDARGMTPQ